MKRINKLLILSTVLFSVSTPSIAEFCHERSITPIDFKDSDGFNTNIKRFGNGQCDNHRPPGGGGSSTIPDPMQHLKKLITSRCNDASALTAAQCQKTQDTALSLGCINETERSWLYKKSYSISCAGVKPYIVCPCSCFDKDTNILTNSIEDPMWIEASEITENTKLVTVSNEATKDKLLYETSSIDYTTSGEESIDMYVLSLSNGKTLSITQNHAVVLSNGMLVIAKDLDPATHSLLGMNGETVTINKIDRRQAKDGYVYNFLVKGSSEKNHLVIAEGVIVGDTMYQGSWYDRLGTEILK